MAGRLKLAAGVAAFLAYAWIAGVRNVDEVRRRKAARRAARGRSH